MLAHGPGEALLRYDHKQTKGAGGYADALGPGVAIKIKYLQNLPPKACGHKGLPQSARDYV
jgi:hypothetical protein